MSSAQFITHPALAALPSVRHAFFTRQGGVSAGLYTSLNSGMGSDDDPFAVAENRRRMALALDVGSEVLSTPYQTHSSDTLTVSAPFPTGEPPKADALVTATRGLVIGVSMADCCPVLFADPLAGIVGAAHAGWRGALGGITDSAIAAMEALGAVRSRTIAVLGQCIRQPNYEVGAEFVEQFCAGDAANRRFFLPSAAEHKALFDLAAYVRARLEAAGIGQVGDLELDTYADEARFFSYRRMTHRGEADYGRHVAAIALS
jgi:polyphenol oxidase